MISLTFDLWVKTILFLYSNEYIPICISDISYGLKIPFASASKICKVLIKTRIIIVARKDRKNIITLTSSGKSLAISLYDSNSKVDDILSKI